MASIVQRNKSYSVVYTIYDGEKKRQKWETYHSYVLNGKDILHQFPAAFDEGRTVTVLKRPKTQSSIQTVYLPDYVLDVLRDWKANTETGQAETTGSDSAIFQRQTAFGGNLATIVGETIATVGASGGIISQPTAQQYQLQIGANRWQH